MVEEDSLTLGVGKDGDAAVEYLGMMYSRKFLLFGYDSLAINISHSRYPDSPGPLPEDED